MKACHARLSVLTQVSPSNFPQADFCLAITSGLHVRKGSHFFGIASQFVTSTTGAVLSVMESTTRNRPSRATS